MFSRVRLEASKLSEEKSSFLGFVKNEIKPDKLVKSKVEFSYDAAKRLLGKQAITVNAFCERERPSHIMIMSVDNKQTGRTEFDVAVSELPKGKKEGDFVKVLLILNSDNTIYSHAILDEEPRTIAQDGYGKLVSQISEAAEFDVADFRDESVYKYLQKVGGCATMTQVWEELFSDCAWDYKLLESSICEDSRLAIRREGGEKVVFLNEARTTTTTAQKPAKPLTSNHIIKYLQKKPQGATLKQIQSRFKGYSGNKCKEIAALVTLGSGLQILFCGPHFSQSLVQIQNSPDSHQTFCRVKSILADMIGADERLVESSTRLIEDLGADSLDLAEIVMAVEEEFDISVPDEDAEKIKTVGDIARYVEERLGDGE